MAYDYVNIKKFERGQINGLTKRLSQHRWHGDYSKRHLTNDLVYKDAESLGLEIQYHSAGPSGETWHFKKPRKITREQSNLGKTWLREYFFKKNGEPRSGKRTEWISGEVLNIAKDVSRFDFVGVIGFFNGFGELTIFKPIYRSFNRKGKYFDYAPVHWGEPIICG